MFDHEYANGELKALLNVYSLHRGNYYFKIAEWIAGGNHRLKRDDVHFSRRQFPGSAPFYHCAICEYESIIEALGERIDAVEKDWKDNASYRQVKCPTSLSVGYIPLQET